MKYLSIMLMALLIAPMALAAELGDMAKPLDVAAWVKGSPVNLSQGKGKTVYVVEFWATWCPPCRASIPHMTKLQKKFKDKGVVFVGVSEEDEGTVKPFVEKMGDKMNYHVAVDKDGATAKGYMQAFNQNGIPTAFIIDKQGRVAWLGHPMGDLENVLDEVVSGKYDLAAVKARMARLAKVRDQLQKFDTVCSSGDVAKVNEMAKGYLKDSSDIPELLGNAAWIMLNHKELKNPDYKLALQLSEAALKASKEQVPELYHINAKARYMTGDKAGAIAMQQKAVDLADSPDAKSFFENALKAYKNGTAEGSATSS